MYNQNNFQQQSYHTSNYRGNQQGHDSYLRSDSTQANSSYGGFGGSQVTSQYRGNQQAYKPTGYVPSVYGQTSVSNFTSYVPFQSTQQYGNTASQSQYGTNVNPQSYHTANYRGDQQGHDSYLRGDSQNPSQSQFGFQTASFQNQSNYRTIPNQSSFVGLGVSSLGATSTGFQSQNQTQLQNQYNQGFVSPEAFHTANYRGNQQGHDSYLRGDSQNPSQSQFGFAGNVSTTSNINNFGTSSFGGNLNRSSF